jgi:NAD(P)-dependent dehydrogenase (short-subunit alcohol dehydrogenase family)
VARSSPRRRGVLITGGARRVGAAIAKALAEDGWFIIVHYNKSESEAASLAKSLNRNGKEICYTIQADLNEKSGIETLIPRSAEIFAQANIQFECLINNAGRFVYDNLNTMTWESWSDHLVPGLYAPVFLSKYFAEAIKTSEQGLIINMVDQKVENLNPDFFSYTISKYSLYGATKLLAMTLAPRIRVCAIAPGILLPSGKQDEKQFEIAWRRTPLGRNATVEEVVQAVRFLIATDSATGNVIVLDGGESLMRRGRDVAFEV